MARKMTLKRFEKSATDRKMDRGLKEGSKADMKADKAAVTRINRKVGGKK